MRAVVTLKLSAPRVERCAAATPGRGAQEIPVTEFDRRTLAPADFRCAASAAASGQRILAPDGGELTPPTKPQPDGVLVKALARGWRWQKLLDRGVYSSVTEIAEAEKISKSYVSRILRLALLAPDLVEASSAVGGSA